MFLGGTIQKKSRTVGHKTVHAHRFSDAQFLSDSIQTKRAQCDCLVHSHYGSQKTWSAGACSAPRPSWMKQTRSVIAAENPFCHFESDHESWQFVTGIGLPNQAPAAPMNSGPSAGVTSPCSAVLDACGTRQGVPLLLPVRQLSGQSASRPAQLEAGQNEILAGACQQGGPFHVSSSVISAATSVSPPDNCSTSMLTGGTIITELPARPP